MADSEADYGYDSDGRRIQTRFKGAGTDFSATQNAKSQNVKSLGSMIRKGTDGFVPPKQKEGEDSATYGARVSQARSAFSQSKAMR